MNECVGANDHVIIVVVVGQAKMRELVMILLKTYYLSYLLNF